MEQNTAKPFILVLGGTGTQGGNVARELLKHGHRVRILTRNVESAGAKQMAAKGAEIVQGDLADLASLDPAMENVSAIFSVSFADPSDPTVEPRNAGNMVQAAIKAGIEQVVHTSVAGTNLFPRWDKYELLSQGFEAKYAIEELIRNGGFKYWTVLHPCWFMENFVDPNAIFMAPRLKEGVLFGVMNGDTPIKLNSGEDTAKFARAAFENPEKYNAKDINISSDELSMNQIAQTLSSVLDRKVVFETIDNEEGLKRGLLQGTIYAMEWMDNVLPGYGFKIEETQQYGIALKTFAEWVEENRDRFEIS